MNKWQEELEKLSLAQEKKILKEIEQQYKKAMKDVEGKIAELMGRTDLENQSSIIYQLNYQNALKGQIGAILDDLKSNNFTHIQDYLKQSYENGFIGTMYDIHNQGVPLIMPIDQEQMVRAIMHDTKLSENLYNSLGMDINELKKEIRHEISRGISQNYSFDQISRQINIRGDVYKNKAYRIARTEGHRIQQEARHDAQLKAKEAGADIVKQWDAALDSRTRKTHTELDGKIVEVDKPFKLGGMEAMYPGGFGVAALDINCRCVLLSRAKWALDEDELEELKKRAEYFGLDKTEDFNDYKKKYLGAVEEISHPFKDKEFYMNPYGNLVEGTSLGHTSYKMDIPSDKVYTVKDGESYNYMKLKEEGYAAIVKTDGKITIVDPSKLEAIDAVDDLKKKTFSLNEDGTYHFGKIKDQAEYQIDIPENKILNIDLKNSTPDDDFILFNDMYDMPEDYAKKAAQHKAMIEGMPEDIQKDLFSYVKAETGFDFEEIADLAANIDDESLNAFYKIHGYDAVKVLGKGDIDDFLKVLDDSVITKTKKSKVETLTEKLGKEQKKLDKIDNKTYKGIWKDDVQLSDYPEKKESIQAKKDYYNQSISNMKSSMDSMPESVQKKWKQQIVDFEKHLDELEEYEKLGIEYEKQLAKVKKTQADLDKLKPKTITSSTSSGLYSQTSKDNAYWFTNANGSTKAADGVLRGKSGEVWRNATKAQQKAAYEYTAGSGKFNRPLSGYEGSWSKYSYKGVKKASLDAEGAAKQIKDLTKLINTSEYDFDIWLQRGCENDAIEAFLNLDYGKLYKMTEKQLQQYVGYNNRIYSFVSTAVSKGKGFGGEVIMNIYAPRGSKMIYAEPFSHYGNGAGLNWDGKSKQMTFGYEAEMLLQRGGSYTITKIEKKGGQIFMDLEIHPEDGYDLFE